MKLSSVIASLLLTSFATVGTLSASTASLSSSTDTIIELAPVVVEATRETSVAATVQTSIDDIRAGAVQPISVKMNQAKSPGRLFRVLPVSGTVKRLPVQRTGRL